MGVKHVLIAAIITISGGTSASAQSVPPPPPQSTATTSSTQSPVRVTTRVVQVSVTVHDDHGRPVTGLTKNDFLLFDQGQRQQIASFSEQANRVTTNAAAPTLFTNRFTDGAAQPPLTVIVLDVFNARYWDMHYCPPPTGPPACAVDPIFNAVDKFIAQMRPEDHVALYELTDHLYLLQDFTSDPGALQRGLVQAKKYAAELHIARSQTFAADMEALTMGAMHSISDRLAKVPGRKNFIWLSTGFPPLPQNDGGVSVTYEKIDKTAKTLGDADSPLFAIDARGFVGGGGSAGPVPGGGGRGPTTGVDLPHPSEAGGCSDTAAGCPPGFRDFEYSKNLAEESGGGAIYGTNDLAGAIRRVVDDSSSTYILGYYPDHNKWNGEFREIKVKVNRSGLEVHARKGYYAVADTASASQRGAQKFADAIRSPLESTDLGFDVQADGAEVSGARQLKVRITLDANQLRFQQQGVRWMDNVTETWAQFTAEGEKVGAKSQTINLKPTQEIYQQLLKQGLSFSETVPVEKNAEEVRLVLRDTGSGAIGSVIIPLSRIFASTAEQAQTKK